MVMGFSLAKIFLSSHYIKVYFVFIIETANNNYNLKFMQYLLLL